jgi:short subunit dehydrogenase-like uncharacterized protein
VSLGACPITISFQYMERMQLEYHKKAEEKGVYCISACGFDSIPAEIGTLYFMQQFKGMVSRKLWSIYENR